MSIQQLLKTTILTVALLWVGSSAALAGPVNYFVTINTSSIVGSGPFGLAFQLVDGSGTGDANNTVILSNFKFGAGSAGAVDLTAGGVSGNMSSTVTLLDSNAFFDAFAQNFTPGASLSFEITTTNNGDAGGFNDLFLTSLLNGSGTGIPTLDPSGNDSLLTIAMTGVSAYPSVGAWGTDTSQTAVVVPKPNVVTPEPGTWMLLGCGLAALGLRRPRRQP